MKMEKELTPKLRTWIIFFTFGYIWQITSGVPCSYPGSPAHAIVTFNTDTIETGTVATYKCEPGFDLLGPLRRLCIENGTWVPVGVPVCVLNVALGKAPMQSSIAGKGVPQKAVDGSTSRAFNADTCSFTELEVSPWWYVNLLEPFLVQLVRLDFGRSCCSNNKPATVVVRVGNNRPDLSANPICNRFTGRIEEGRPLFFPCTNPVTGAFVSVHIDTPAPVSLSICEAFVYTDRVLPIEQCPVFDDLPLSATSTYSGKCYTFHNNLPRDMESARRYCELHGGTMVHETSPALQGFLSWELYKRHRKDSGSDYWNGAVRQSGSKTWKWIDGKDVNLSFWSVPPKAASNVKTCSKFNATKGWLWSDTECNNLMNFICQHKPVSCGSPERPQNSSTLLRATAISSTVTYQCDHGHLLVGPTSRVCLPTGFYTDFAPKCTYLECGFPANIPNGGYKLINGSRMYLNVVQYFCHEGFVMVGRANLVCDSDEKWDGPPPRCDPILCHNPPSITNGNVTLTVNLTVSATSAEYVCESGYRLYGDKSVFCDSTGLWIPDPPTCEVDRAKLMNARYDAKNKRNKSIASRLNMGGIIALGIFGGFVFLAVIISIVVIIIRRSSKSRDSVDSLSTYETGGSRERLYQQQQQQQQGQQCWRGHPPPAVPHTTDTQQETADVPCTKVKKSPDREKKDPHNHHHRERHHKHHYRDTDGNMEAGTSNGPGWCPKHDKRPMY